jgi:sarcosine oxidase
LLPTTRQRASGRPRTGPDQAITPHPRGARRIVIVGGGVIGLMTAVECVRSGHEVVLLDQGEIPFAGATSFDRHHTIRALNLRDPTAVAAAVQAHHHWVALQQFLSTRFYEQVGTLTVLPPQELPRAMSILTAAGSQAHVLNPDELTSRYPHVEFPIGESAVFESLAGVLLADRILTACADWLERSPKAELLPFRRAVRVDAVGASVRLEDGEIVSGDAVLLAGGPWSRELLAPALGSELILYRQSMLYCDVPALDDGVWSATPAILSIGMDGCAWLIPPVADTPLKLSGAGVCRVAEQFDGTDTPPRWRDLLIKTFAAVIPGFHADWLIDARDSYYLARASTDGAMVTMLGERVVSFTACGGSSFRLAPLIARSLAGRLSGGEPAPVGLDALDTGVVRLPPDAAAGF